MAPRFRRGTWIPACAGMTGETAGIDGWQTPPLHMVERGPGGEADSPYPLDAAGELLASDEQVAAVTRDDIVPDMHSVGTLVVGVLPPGVVVGEVAKL